MTLHDFQAFVACHTQQCSGVKPHSAEDFDTFEREIGHALPESLRWLLGEYGYSDGCGIGNLEDAVAQTLACRKSISLPLNWLLINDWGDGGIVLLDLPTGRICWCGSHNAGNLATGKIDADAEWFAGYPEWVASRIASLD